MELKTYQLLVDFGLVVLIFLVQLCIYPAFKYFKSDNLKIWHRVYTPNITYVVFPLMLIQLFLSAYSTYFSSVFINWLHLVLVLLTWIGTFVFYVPLHQKINTGKFMKEDLLKLEKSNWLRVFLWFFVFGISLLMHIKH